MIHSDMTLDSKILIHTDDTVCSTPMETTQEKCEPSDVSPVLPSMNKNSDSLIKTEEFLEFVYDLPNEEK